MGTSIELRIGRVSLSYSKNDIGADYGALFQTGDEASRELDQIAYDYYDEHPELASELEEHEAVFARRLDRILPRLDLLGWTLEAARHEYESVVAEARDTDSYVDSGGNAKSYLSFDEFCALANRIPLSQLRDEALGEDFAKLRTKAAQGRFADDEQNLSRIPMAGSAYWSEATFVADKLCILSAESMLRIFGLNPANASVEVVWEFGPLVLSGWADREDFQPNARRQQQILVATEGVSDVKIIKRALHVLRPDVADFFHFVDVEERHHFWGIGNLVRFGEGLLRINIQNKVLFVLDNDAEGVDAHEKFKALNMPGNMRATLLPSVEELTHVPARGPEGVKNCDINGKAAAIECYLDLELPTYPPAQVLWSSYKRDIDAWQGALEHKESYQRHFFEQSDEAIRSGPYNASKLSKLIDSLIAEAALLAD